MPGHTIEMKEAMLAAYTAMQQLIAAFEVAKDEVEATGNGPNDDATEFLITYTNGHSIAQYMSAMNEMTFVMQVPYDEIVAALS